MPKVEYTWAMLGLYTLCNCSTLAMTGTVMAAVTPSRLMGKVTALYFLIANLLGFALGPTVFALVAKWFFSGSMIRSIQVSFPIAILICVAFLSYAAHQLYRWRLVNQP